MTTFDTCMNDESVSELANKLYHQGISPPERELPCAPAQPAPESIRQETLETMKPAAAPEFISMGSGEYYFLKTVAQPDQPQTPADSKNQGRRACEPETIRRDFPILEQRINGHPLIWFDNAATTQKPRVVLDCLNRFYREINSNVHRGAHTLSRQATDAYETAREKVQRFVGAPESAEIIFLRGTTEAINLVAQSYGGMYIGRGDEILISVMEHHSNIVPWQMLSRQTGAIIRPIPINRRGEIMLGEYERMLSRRTRMVAITQVSNVLGTINPVRLMAEMAHYYGARVMIDGAQAVPHFPVDVKLLDADFYAFSGHKIYGPTGIGVLYGKRDLLEEMPPWQGGGGMIQEVSFDETTYQHPPHKFEAGTANIADAVGLGAAIDYLRDVGLASIAGHEQQLTVYAMERLGQIPGLRIFGTAPHKTAVISFVTTAISPDDLARYLDQHGIAVRSGHHCAQPLLHHYHEKSMLRVSLGLYNTREEVDQLAEVIGQAIRNSS